MNLTRWQEFVLVNDEIMKFWLGGICSTGKKEVNFGFTGQKVMEFLDRVGGVDFAKSSPPPTHLLGLDSITSAGDRAQLDGWNDNR